MSSKQFENVEMQATTSQFVEGLHHLRGRGVCVCFKAEWVGVGVVLRVGTVGYRFCWFCPDTDLSSCLALFLFAVWSLLLFVYLQALGRLLPAPHPGPHPRRCVFPLLC